MENEIVIFGLDPCVATHAWRLVAICLGLWILTLIAIMLDLWDGLYTAKKTGKLIHSHKLRVTIDKICEYWRFMLIAFVIDCVGILFPFYNFPYVSILFFLGLVGVEVKSMLEHAKDRKSGVTQAKQIIEKIIECSTSEKAKELMTLVQQFDTNEKKK